MIASTASTAFSFEALTVCVAPLIFDSSSLSAAVEVDGDAVGEHLSLTVGVEHDGVRARDAGETRR